MVRVPEGARCEVETLGRRPNYESVCQSVAHGNPLSRRCAPAPQASSTSTAFASAAPASATASSVSGVGGQSSASAQSSGGPASSGAWGGVGCYPLAGVEGRVGEPAGAHVAGTWAGAEGCTARQFATSQLPPGGHCLRTQQRLQASNPAWPAWPSPAGVIRVGGNGATQGAATSQACQASALELRMPVNGGGV